ncbi:ribonuclease H-like domain-containing protein [Cerioporus squamosus]|nr:ribonuclease H-like domain-containing protein [Cerioporus squamosus]
MAAPKYTLCETYDSVAVAASTLSASSILILDCEARDIGCTNGVLSIVSVSDVDAKNIFLIDALALPDSSNPAFMPLFDLLRSEAVKKLMWDGRADALELRETYGVELRGVLDLQLAEVVSRWSVRGQTDDFRRRRLATGYFRKMIADISRNPDEYEGIYPVIGINACLKECQIRDSKDAAVAALYNAHGSEIWLQRPLPEILLRYAAHDLTLIAALYASFLRRGWIKEHTVAVLEEQSTRYILTFHAREIKDLFDESHVAMFVPLHVFEATSSNAQRYECEWCKQQLAPHCFSTVRRDQGRVQQRSTLCKLCAALAKRNSQPARIRWVNM